MNAKTAGARVGVVLVALAAAAQAASGLPPGGHREHGAHEHGAARLDIAAVGEEVLIGLDSPAANIVGFEHLPRTEAERSALDEAVARLKDGERLFRLSPAADCRLVGVSVSSPLLRSASHSGKGDAGDRGEGHDHDHDREEAHAHDDGPGHADGEEAHADIAAEYRFVCAAPERLAGLQLGLFEGFPAIERLAVQTVTERGQSAATLTPGDADLKL